MDLIAGGSQLIIIMEHSDSKGRPKLVRSCHYPVSARACVDIIVTDLALLVRRGDRFVVEEIAPGFTAEEIKQLTDMDLLFSDNLRVMHASEDHE
jgi:3-oxoacid CoA-transferase